MATQKDKWKDVDGFRRSLVSKSKGGLLILWDTAISGCRLQPSKQGHRWCLEHIPEGRAKRQRMYVSTVAAANTVIRSLAKGVDDWGFWPEKNPKKKKTKSGEPDRDVSQSSLSSEGGGGGSLTMAGLTGALREKFPEHVIAEKFKQLLEASKPIYSNTGGNVEVVEHEPDYPVQLQALKLLMAYRDGQPIQRKEELRRTVTTEGEMMKKVAMNPNYRRGLRKYIESLDKTVRDGPSINTPSQDADTSGQ